MAQSTFSLSWEAHKNNICSGLSELQQREEFVDMTLAADGHFVKVHQMVMALASPYFKNLIASAAGRHPVIFLNKISYTTLSAILEYIYTGEVLISIDNLSDLIQSAKELHIKGLEDMKLQNPLNNTLSPDEGMDHDPDSGPTEHSVDDEICYFEVTDQDDTQSQRSLSTVHDDGVLEDTRSVKSLNATETDLSYVEVPVVNDVKPKLVKSHSESSPAPSTLMQYTVSNQGSVQMVLNRYIYYLKHSNRNGSRQWRCVDYLAKSKCPAIVVTKDSLVKQRIAVHKHMHHDRKIMKKINAGAVFSAITEAEMQGEQIRTKMREEKLEALENSRQDQE